jgi:hypothetical protein
VTNRHVIHLVLILAAASLLRCAGAVKATHSPTAPSTAALWVQPDDVSRRDLFNGPWGAALAPNPKAEYTFVRPKQNGVNPGVVVRDPQGREWHVKQAPAKNQRRGDEGPSEVAMSRVLSALGYHQPPVYYLPSFTMRDDSGVHTAPGGRFRLDLSTMKDLGPWSWQQNPYVGQRPYQGLLVILMMFNSSDLKNSNNSIYEVTERGRATHQYVVRDLGDALGRTGRISSPRNNVDAFADTKFITGINGKYVDFDFHALHGELVRNRITPEDVVWATNLMGKLSERQWQDAFRAGGYDATTAGRFITILRSRVVEGQHLPTGTAATR